MPAATRLRPPERAARLRELAGFITKTVAADQAPRLQLLARQVGDSDWDDDPGRLAQAADAVLDEALTAFQEGETDQGVALTIAAAATLDQLLAAMALPDADELGPEGPGAMGMNSRPTDGLIRARSLDGVELRAADAGDGMPTLYGHFAVFDQWTEITSFFEGNFMERVARESMDVTFRDDRDAMRVLFQHGMDPQIGSKPLGPIDTLEAQKRGAYYEVPLLDTDYVRSLLPGLEKKLYGASMRFQVLAEEWKEKPGRSNHNPDGLPERTVTQAKVLEFGPVTFGAYQQATAGVRSLTDEFVLPQLALGNPGRLHDLIHQLTGRPAARSTGGGGSRSDDRPGKGTASLSLAAMQIRDRELRIKGIL